MLRERAESIIAALGSELVSQHRSYAKNESQGKSVILCGGSGLQQAGIRHTLKP